MKASIGNSLLAKIKVKDRAYDIRDDKLSGFLIRVNPSGFLSYACEYARGKRVTLGKVGVLTPAQARDMAREVLADVVKGADPKAPKRQDKNYTLRDFLETEYKPWAEANLKRGGEGVTRIKLHFLKDLGHTKLQDITVLDVEKWRTKRLKNGIKTTTVNRDIAALKSALTKAVTWKFIATNPLAEFKLQEVDHSDKTRYLSKEEEKRLRHTLDERDEELKSARERANAWRRARKKPEMPDLRLQAFADRMKPMILLSINTGLRKGELLSLTWADINLDLATLTIRVEVAKSGKARHIPLNTEALAILQNWLKQSETTGLVFPGDEDKPLTDVKKSWASILKKAKIIDFRWHDLRHHFASKLVMAGVDLNTVRELLGHADITMTLRYTHLAPEHKADAVARLVANNN